MREKQERSEHGRRDDANPSEVPDERQSNTGQAEGQVVVHETHVENVAISEHGDAGGEGPWRTATGRLHESEEAPKENENAKGNRDFLGRGEAKEFCEVEKHEVEEHVVPLPDDVDARGSSLFDELGEPGIVEVTAEIARLDVAVPKAGDQEESGNQEDEQPLSKRVEELY